MKLAENKESTKWTTMAIRKNPYDRLGLMANYEHRTVGEMVAVMLRGYYELIAKDMNMTTKELVEFLNKYERD